jgi:cbb3-type cytochrome oxidase subunit 1
MEKMALTAAILAFAGMAILITATAITIRKEDAHLRLAHVGMFVLIGAVVLAVIDSYSAMRHGAARWEPEMISDMIVLVTMLVAILPYATIMPYRPITSRA